MVNVKGPEPIDCQWSTVLYGVWLVKSRILWYNKSDVANIQCCIFDILYFELGVGRMHECMLY